MLEAEFLNEAVLGGAACTGKSSRVLVDGTSSLSFPTLGID